MESGEPVFVMLHLADPSAPRPAQGVAGTRFLQAHMEPFAATNPLVETALSGLEERPEKALADLDQMFRRGRGSAEHAALQSSRYDSQVAVVDEVLGNLLELLEDTGRLEDSVVAFTSTRGASLVAGRDPEDPAFGPGLISVPLVLRLPGATGVSRVPGLVRSLDVAPTLAAACGLEWNHGTTGQNILPLLPELERRHLHALVEAAGLEARAIVDSAHEDGAFHVSPDEDN